MTVRLVMTKKDPRRTDFVLVGDTFAHGHRRARRGSVATPLPTYTSDTTPRTGGRTTTTITRTDTAGDRFQVGVIEWPLLPQDHVQVVVGTRPVSMSKSGIYTSPERFTATDGRLYEWQIRDARPQLVPLRTYNHTSDAHVATFVQSHSGSCFRRKYSSSLFIPPEGINILDDIIVTFIYFESKWRDKEGAKSRASISGPL